MREFSPENPFPISPRFHAGLEHGNAISTAVQVTESVTWN